MRSALLFAALALLIMLWQFDLSRHPQALDTAWRINGGGTGIQRSTPSFLYFFYYLDLFPLTTTATDLVESVEGAKNLLNSKPETLSMNRMDQPRYGDPDPGQILLYLPWAWRSGSAKDPSVIPFHAVVFQIALLLLIFQGLRWGGSSLTVPLAILAGSNPFQLYEVYGNENLFGWLITLTLLMIALHWRILRGKDTASFARALILPLACGLIFGTIRQIRSEPLILLLPVAATYLLNTQAKWLSRFSMIAVLVVTFLLTAATWERYFSNKFNETRDIVSSLGGQVFSGPRIQYHKHWHPLFCGLGDFGADRGYGWEDRVAYAYAAPKLEATTGTKLRSFNDGWCYTWDTAPGSTGSGVNHECNTLEILDGYEQIIQDKVIGDITSEPSWYAGILWARLVRIASELVPVRISWAGGALPLGNGLLWLGVATLLAPWFFSRAALGSLLFCLAPSLVPLLIYSGGGTTSYSIIHLGAAAGLISLIFKNR